VQASGLLLGGEFDSDGGRGLGLEVAMGQVGGVANGPMGQEACGS
jgi:hypothetical protein